MWGLLAMAAAGPEPASALRRVGWWSSLNLATEVAAHSARRDPDRTMRTSAAPRLSGRVGLGGKHSVFLDLSGSVGVLRRALYAGAIAGLGGRFGVGAYHIDGVLGLSIEGGADSGPVAILGGGRSVGNWVVDVRVRLPSALLVRDHRFFGGPACSFPPCAEPAVYRADYGTLGLSVGLGVFTDRRGSR